MMGEYVNCFACGARSLNIEGETHRYILSAPGCWAMYNEVLEKEYADVRYAKAHHFTVDAYACQHPGKPEVRQAVNSVGIHLSCLYMVFEKGMALSEGARFKTEFATFNKKHRFIKWLEPPDNLGAITVFDVWNLEEPHQHYDMCRNWAASTFQAWKAHHETVRSWVEDFLTAERFH